MLLIDLLYSLISAESQFGVQIHRLDLGLEHLVDHFSFEFHCGGQNTKVQRELQGENFELSDSLYVGSRLFVCFFYPLPHQLVDRGAAGGFLNS